MTKKSDTPAIRFKGFTDTWEQRKLGDIGKARSGVGFPDAEQGGVTGIPFFKVSDMNFGGNENEMTVANNYVTAEQIAVHRWSPITELPAIFFAKVGAAVMLNRKRLCRFPFLLDNNTMAYSLSSTKWDADFAKALFGTVDLTSLVQVGALPSYNAGDVESMKIYLPSLLEQEQIGGFFKQLDNLITLHQRKYDKLTNVKKSMLEKMFPKNGSNVPEIRFKGFTEAWEQRKLTEFVEFFSGLTYTPNDVQENGTLVLRSSNVSNGEVVDADNIYVNPQVVNSENVKVGDIVVVVRNGSRSLIGKHAQIKAFMPNTVIGAFMTGIRSECPEFTNALLNTSRFEEEIAMNMGATINQITGYMFSKMEFKVPCLDEQKKIGEYFEKLDNLITLHQRELEKLKNIKKSCLENMFV
ncbi:restriction endonuclease subunit S [[Clostridium] innocuum]|uniref:restriction endonuclease subunit S n=1 Tax=Clostridium innocuum TaxID=1522 RepID=UPI0032D52762